MNDFERFFYQSIEIDGVTRQENDFHWSNCLFVVVVEQPADVVRRFGQTFLLDVVKTEQIENVQRNYIRPTIPDVNDVVIILDRNEVERRSSESSIVDD